MKRVIVAFIGLSSMLVFLFLMHARLKTDELEFKPRTESTEENPFAASQYRFDMLRGKSETIPPLVRRRAIEYTKRNLFSKKLDKSKNIDGWSALGPGNIGGRIRSLILRPSNPDEMLVGAVSGGVWKSTDGGAHWTPKNDDGEFLAIGCMANYGDIVYAGTGEGWNNFEATFGGGIWKSTDFGETWELLPSTLSNDGWDFRNVRQIRISPNGTVYAVTFAYNKRDNGGDYYDNGGLWKSTDAGNSWTKISNEQMTNYYNGSDMLVISENVLLFATYAGWIYRTTDGGTNWTKITNGLPRVSDYNRIALGQDPNSPETVYAVFSSWNGDGLRGVFRSTNGGASWTQLENPPRLPSTRMNSYLWRQGWYDNVIAINPFNSNHIYLGGVEMVRSTDGGNTWEQVAYGYPRYGEPVLHVDHHAIVFHPDFPGVIFDCNDGGIYKTTDSGASWLSLNNNLEITQFHGGAVSYDGDVFQGGTQDNGHLKYTGGTDWTEIFGGDGGYAAISQTDSKICFEEYVYLDIHISFDGGETWWRAIDGLDDANNSSETLFIAPYAMNPDNSQIMVAGSDNVWFSNDLAENWTASSGQFTDGKVSAVAVFGATPPYLSLAGTTDGRVFKCTNITGNNDEWTEITPPGNNGAWVRRLTVDPNDYDKIYAVYSGYNNDGITPTKHVWYSPDQGENWRDISGNLPDVPVHSIIVNPSDGETLYIGTETGVYQTTDRGTNWIKAGSGMPDYVPVYELVLQKGTNRIFAFTHGRGVFVTSMPLPVEISTFTADVKLNCVELKWETETEVNSFGFEIQRKSEDKPEWQTVGTVGGKGNSNTKSTYSFTDYPDVYGVLNYRLKQLDNDGQVNYSSILTVEYYGANKFELYQNYPNPFNPVTTIKYSIPSVIASEPDLSGERSNLSNNTQNQQIVHGTLRATNLTSSNSRNDANVQLVVYDILGRKISTLVNKRQSPGEYSVQFDASDLPSGTYFYTLRVGDFVATKKMQLMK